ncbi:MAG: hypothetical protein ACLR4Z_07785 [Butyricicoccaceae bacterium]
MTTLSAKLMTVIEPTHASINSLGLLRRFSFVCRSYPLKITPSPIFAPDLFHNSRKLRQTANSAAEAYRQYHIAVLPL